MGRKKHGLRQIGKYWYVRMWLGGKEYNRSTGKQTYKDAIQAAHAIREQIRFEHERPLKMQGTLQWVADHDIERAQITKKNPDYIKTLQFTWALLMKHFGATKNVITITSRDLDRFVNYRFSQNVRGQTIKKNLQCLKRGLNWAIAQGAMRELPRPWPHVQSDPKCEKRSGRLVDPADLEKILPHLPEHIKDELIFVFLTGLRLYELKRITFEMIEPCPGDAPALIRLPAHATKNKVSRIIGLNNTALEILKKRNQHGSYQDPIFPAAGNRQAIQKACKRAGVALITHRALRHTYATLALQITNDPVALQLSLGHTDLAMTNRYLSSTIERVTNTGLAIEQALLSNKTVDNNGSHKTLAIITPDNVKAFKPV